MIEVRDIWKAFGELDKALRDGKTGKEINSTTPVWWPTTWTMKNYEKLMSKFKAPLFELTVPFSQYFSALS